MTGKLARLVERIEGPRAWTGLDTGDAQPWLVALPSSWAELLDGAIESWRRDRCSITDIRLDEGLRCSGREAFGKVLSKLEAGRGFVVLDRLPLDRMDPQEAILAYWLIGQMLGEPFVQNIKGTLLFDVQDTGADYTKGARFSVTNVRSSFHTDGAFNPVKPDYVGLLCLQTARRGGENQMFSAYTLHNALVDRFPHLLETLYEPFYFDRRGEFVAGESPTTRSPVFCWDGSELTIRYINYYIHEGHRNAGRELMPRQIEALGVVEQLLEEMDLFVQFSLEPGQMLFSNNHWILHNRNAFEDHEDSKQRRHYVRLWLSRETDHKP